MYALPEPSIASPLALDPIDIVVSADLVHGDDVGMIEPAARASCSKRATRSGSRAPGAAAATSRAIRYWIWAHPCLQWTSRIVPFGFGSGSEGRTPSHVWRAACPILECNTSLTPQKRTDELGECVLHSGFWPSLFQPRRPKITLRPKTRYFSNK